MGERVSIVVISTITYSCHFVYRAICHFTGKILGPGGGLSDRNSKPFPFQLPFPLSLILSLYPYPPSFSASFNVYLFPFPRFTRSWMFPRFSRSRFQCFALSRAQSLSFPTPVPPTLPFTSQLWILLSNTYVARAATRLDVCVRGCVRAVCSHARVRSTCACALATHAGERESAGSHLDFWRLETGNDTTTRPFLSAAALRERERGLRKTRQEVWEGFQGDSWIDRFFSEIDSWQCEFDTAERSWRSTRVGSLVDGLVLWIISCIWRSYHMVGFKGFCNMRG